MVTPNYYRIRVYVPEDDPFIPLGMALLDALFGNLLPYTCPFFLEGRLSQLCNILSDTIFEREYVLFKVALELAQIARFAGIDLQPRVPALAAVMPELENLLTNCRFMTKPPPAEWGPLITVGKPSRL